MPAVTRIGDADVAHCSGMTRAAGSGDVFVNGIGVSRLVGAIIESSHDDKGIIWPKSVSPFDICIINLLVGNKSCDEMSLKVYEHFKSLNKEILYDDTNESTGSKLASMDLIGIPYQIIVGPRLAKDNKYEVKIRTNGDKYIVDFENLINLVI